MGYEEERKEFKYYKKTHDIIEDIQKKTSINNIVDVGGWKGFFVENTNIKDKTVIDLHKMEDKSDGVTRISTNFLEYNPEKKYDIVTCLQVLEHINDNDVEKFAKKLFDISEKYVVISVPYKWKKGICKWHCQDPVDKDKLLKWTSVTPNEEYIITDRGMDRLISVYKI